jgi:hypothetical protein
MLMSEHEGSVAYGWEDFDQALVEQIERRDPATVVTGAGGFIACPIIGHPSERLRWLNGGGSSSAAGGIEAD